MSISALVAIFKIEKHAYFNLAGGTMMIDAIYRLSAGVNHFYGYLKYQDISPAPSAPGAVRVVTNLWPSHIMLFIEIILITMIFRLFMGMKQSIVETSS